MDEKTREILEKVVLIINNILSGGQSNIHWISIEDDMPLDNERVVVRTKDGATFFLSPINGKFTNNVTHWLRIPQVK